MNNWIFGLMSEFRAGLFVFGSSYSHTSNFKRSCRAFVDFQDNEVPFNQDYGIADRSFAMLRSTTPNMMKVWVGLEDARYRTHGVKLIYSRHSMYNQSFDSLILRVDVVVHNSRTYVAGVTDAFSFFRKVFFNDLAISEVLLSEF